MVCHMMVNGVVSFRVLLRPFVSCQFASRIELFFLTHFTDFLILILILMLI
jgi:hypothetical protein